MSKSFFLAGVAAFSLNLVRPLGLNISIPDTLFLLAAIGVILGGIARKEPMGEWMPIHQIWIPAILMLIGGMMASMNASGVYESLNVTFKTVIVFSLWISVCLAFVRRGETESIVTAFIITGMATSLVAIADFASGGAIAPYLPGGDTMFWSRYPGLMGHPNNQAMILITTAPLCLNRGFGNGTFGRSFLVRLGYFACFVLLLIGIALSGSVSGFTAIILTSGVIVTIKFANTARHSSINKTIVYTTSLILVIIILFVLGDKYGLLDQFPILSGIDRVSNVTGPDRLALIKETIWLIGENPFFGYGMDQMATSGIDRTTSFLMASYTHNTLLLMWLSGGLLAFVGALWVYGFAWKTTVAVLIEGCHGRWMDDTLGLAVSTLGWSLVDMFQAAFYDRYKWLVLALLIGTYYRERASHVPSNHRVSLPSVLWSSPR